MAPEKVDACVDAGLERAWIALHDCDISGHLLERVLSIADVNVQHAIIHAGLLTFTEHANGVPELGQLTCHADCSGFASPKRGSLKGVTLEAHTRNHHDDCVLVAHWTYLPS